MLVLEAKLRGKQEQCDALDEAIRTALFIRNCCLRYWMDNRGVGKNDLQKLCAVLGKEFEWDAIGGMKREDSPLTQIFRYVTEDITYRAVLSFPERYLAAGKLNSQARQASADRAWFAICRFFANCKAKKPGLKGFPRFKKRGHSVEYKTTGWVRFVSSKMER